jgi:uncharacterized repeat protein (TIGR03803 family)
MVINSPGGSNDYESLYELPPNNKLALINRFPSAADSPQNLTVLSDGTIYGITEEGGRFGCGSIFRIDSQKRFETLYSFTGKQFDGGDPDSLVLGDDGNLYGTTRWNGANGANGVGTIFKLELSR